MKKFFLPAICFFFLNSLQSQVATRIVSSDKNEFSNLIRKNSMSEFSFEIDTKALIEEDEQLLKTKDIMREAKCFDVNIDIINQGETFEQSGKKIWILPISVPQALRIGVIFLNKGFDGEISLFSQDVSYEFGPFDKNALDSKLNFFATDLLKGNRVYLMYSVSSSLSSAAINSPKVKQLIVSYNSKPKPYENCSPDIACTEGNCWRMEAQSVARISYIDPTTLNVIAHCTGTALNDGYGNTSPKLLTANHCIYDSGVFSYDPTNFLFKFNAWNSGCQSGSEQEGIQFNGASLLTHWDVTDFALLQLNAPTGNTNFSENILFSGWDNASAQTGPTACIHYPRNFLSGDSRKMKISLDNDDPQNGSCSTGPHFWKVHFDVGDIEPGSSGSALFNSDHKVIGQLLGQCGVIGNPFPCTADTKPHYGKLSESWEGDISNNVRGLKYFLNGLSGSTTQSATIAIIGENHLCGTPKQFYINQLLPPFPGGDYTYFWSTDNTNVSVVPDPANPKGCIATLAPNSSVGTANIILQVLTPSTCGSHVVLQAQKMISINSDPSFAYLSYSDNGTPIPDINNEVHINSNYCLYVCPTQYVNTTTWHYEHFPSGCRADTDNPGWFNKSSKTPFIAFAGGALTHPEGCIDGSYWISRIFYPILPDLGESCDPCNVQFSNTPQYSNKLENSVLTQTESPTPVPIKGQKTSSNFDFSFFQSPKISPNPFSVSTKLSFAIPSQSERAVIHVFDLLGREVDALQIRKGEDNILLGENWPEGTFFLKIECDGFKNSIQKVVKF